MSRQPANTAGELAELVDALREFANIPSADSLEDWNERAITATGRLDFITGALRDPHDRPADLITRLLRAAVEHNPANYNKKTSAGGGTS